MKPFNLQLAKEGHPIQTRDGHDARIICFDRDAGDTSNKTIIALIKTGKKEEVLFYAEDGKRHICFGEEDYDLMMKPKTVQKYVNVYKYEQSRKYNRHPSDVFYDTEEEAIKEGKLSSNYITTTSITWEE